MTAPDIDLDALEAAALAAKGWSSCDKAWLDTSEDEPVDVVGHIDEEGNTYPVAVVDCGQYFHGQDSKKLAKFYAASNPAVVLELIRRLRAAEGVKK